jgi:hypothetical protein
MADKKVTKKVPAKKTVRATVAKKTVNKTSTKSTTKKIETPKKIRIQTAEGWKRARIAAEGRTPKKSK